MLSNTNEIKIKGTFKQLLIYDGNLTDEDLKAESSKDIIGDNQLDNNEYPPQYNSTSLFGIENFYGNVKRIVDGFIAKDDGYYYTANPNKMGQATTYEKLSSQVIMGGKVGVEGWSKKIDKQLGVFNIPSELNEQKDALSVIPNQLETNSNFYEFSNKNSNIKTVEETHYTDYFISHAPNKENIAIFGSDFEAEEKAGVFTLDLNKEIDHKDDRTSARLVILP